MERLAQVLLEARIQEDDLNGSKQTAYFRYLAASFITADIVAKNFAFPSPATVDSGEFSKLVLVMEKSLSRAEELLEHVLDQPGLDLDHLKMSGARIAGRGAEPLIADPALLFSGRRDMVRVYGNLGHEEESEDTVGVSASVVPLLPESHLRLDLFSLQYHTQLLMQKLAELDQRPAKEQANAIFLACCHHALSDLVKVTERCIQAGENMCGVEDLHLRNELMTVDKIASEIQLIDRLLWSRLLVEDLNASRMIAVNTVKPVLDYHHFLVGLATSSIVECGGAREKAETIVFLCHIAKRLVSEYGDYNAAAAVVCGVLSERVSGGALELLPSKINQVLQDLQVVTTAESGRSQMLKHPNPIPPVHILLEDVRQTPHPGMSKEMGNLVQRVITHCQSGGFKSGRPDIQHWLLTRSFRGSSWDGGATAAVQEAQSPLPPPRGAQAVPGLRTAIRDPLESIDDDRFGHVLGQYAVTK